MNYPVLALAVVGVVLGGMAIVLGGMDDSPGGQLIGAALVLGSVVFGLRRMRRAPR